MTSSVDMTTGPLNASADEREDVQPGSAMGSWAAHARLWSVAMAALAIDLWTKDWAFETLRPSEVRDAIPGLLTFRRSINSGALFGLGKGLVPLFIVASFVALGFVLYLFACSGRNRKSLHLALSLVLAGSLGNLYDRSFVIADQIEVVDSISGQARTLVGKIKKDDPDKSYVLVGQAPDGAEPRPVLRREIASVSTVGVVRDFLKFEPKIAGMDTWPWIFNVADSLLVIGVIILLLNFWFERKHGTGSDKADAVSAVSDDHSP